MAGLWGLKVLRPYLEHAIKSRFIGRVPLLQTHRFGERKGEVAARDNLSSQFPKIDFRVLLAAFQRQAIFEVTSTV